MIRYSIIAAGRVQGVGFRYFVQLTACRLNLTGWCKNLLNGDVQIEVQGYKDNVESFISAIKAGNYFSKVHNLEMNELQLVVNEKKFFINY